MRIDLEPRRLRDELGQRLVGDGEQFRREVGQRLLVLGIHPLRLREARGILGDASVLIALQSSIDIEVGDDGLDGLDTVNRFQQVCTTFT